MSRFDRAGSVLPKARTDGFQRLLRPEAPRRAFHLNVDAVDSVDPSGEDHAIIALKSGSRLRVLGHRDDVRAALHETWFAREGGTPA